MYGGKHVEGNRLKCNELIKISKYKEANCTARMLGILTLNCLTARLESWSVDRSVGVFVFTTD